MNEDCFSPTCFYLGTFYGGRRIERKKVWFPDWCTVGEGGFGGVLERLNSHIYSVKKCKTRRKRVHRKWKIISRLGKQNLYAVNKVSRIKGWKKKKRKIESSCMWWTVFVYVVNCVIQM